MFRTIHLFLLACCMLGCNSSSVPVVEIETPPPLRPVSIVLVDIPDVSGDIVRQWSARRNGEATVKNITAAELFKDSYSAIDKHDVLIYPSYMMGQLVKDDKIVPFPGEIWDSESLDSRGLLRDARTRQIKLGGNKWGVPLGGANFFLLYRADVLSIANASVPTTWSEFFDLAQSLKAKSLKNSAGDSLPNQTLIPTDGQFAAHILFAMAAANVRQRGKIDFVFDRDTMEPLIASPPYILALQSMKKLVGNVDLSLSPETIAKRLYSSKAAMVIGWPAKRFFADDDSLDIENILENVSIRPLPGAERWFDFASDQWRLRESPLRVNNLGFATYQASILESANYPTSVYEFMIWLGSKQTCSTIWSNSVVGAPARESHLGNPQNWTGEVLTIEESDRYAEISREINTQTVYLTFPRIPGAKEYIDCLSDGIAVYLAGSETKAESCLREIANQWNKITDELGREEQVERLRMDFGL